MVGMQLALAHVHHLRSTVLRFGWHPWRSFLHQSRHISAAADSMGCQCLLRHCYRRWQALVTQQQEARRLQEQEQHQAAKQHHATVLCREAWRGFVQSVWLSRVAAVDAESHARNLQQHRVRTVPKHSSCVTACRSIATCLSVASEG